MTIDYLEEEVMEYNEIYDNLIGRNAHLIPLVRALLRLRRIAWRVSSITPSLARKGLTGVFLGEGNIRLIQMRSHLILERIKRLLVLLFENFPSTSPDDKHLIYSHISALWGAAGADFCDGLQDCVSLIVDIDDVFARMAEFYHERPVTVAAARLGNMVEQFYVDESFSKDDVIAPEQIPRERPLTDLLLDLWGLINNLHEKNIRIVDYGAGLGRTRHYFYALPCELDETNLDNTSDKIQYSMLEIKDAVQSLEKRYDYPNRHKGKTTPCCCLRHSSGDKLLIIDPKRESSVLGSYCIDGIKNNKDLWKARISREWPQEIQVILLVNVLHEVPLTDLPILFSNIRSMLNPYGLLFIYETLGPSKVEELYVVWQPEDIYQVFSRLGFQVVALPGRTRNPKKGSWGSPYVLAALLRRNGPIRDAKEIRQDILSLWDWRIAALVRRIEKLSNKVCEGIGTDSDRFEHFHASQSLVNAMRHYRGVVDNN